MAAPPRTRPSLKANAVEKSGHHPSAWAWNTPPESRTSSLGVDASHLVATTPQLPARGREADQRTRWPAVASAAAGARTPPRFTSQHADLGPKTVAVAGQDGCRPDAPGGGPDAAEKNGAGRWAGMARRAAPSVREGRSSPSPHVGLRRALISSMAARGGPSWQPCVSRCRQQTACPVCAEHPPWVKSKPPTPRMPPMKSRWHCGSRSRRERGGGRHTLSPPFAAPQALLGPALQTEGRAPQAGAAADELEAQGRQPCRRPGAALTAALEQSCSRPAILATNFLPGQPCTLRGAYCARICASVRAERGTHARRGNGRGGRPRHCRQPWSSVNRLLNR